MLKVKKLPDGTVELEGTPEEIAEYERKLQQESVKPKKVKRGILKDQVDRLADRVRALECHQSYPYWRYWLDPNAFRVQPPVQPLVIRDPNPWEGTQIWCNDGSDMKLNMGDAPVETVIDISDMKYMHDPAQATFGMIS